MMTSQGAYPALNQDSTHHQQEILRAVIAMQDLPLQQVAWVKGTALKPWLKELTGLAFGTLNRQLNGKRVRPGKLAEAQCNAKKTAVSRLSDAGFTDAEVASQIDRVKQAESLGGAGWSGWVLAMEPPEIPVLERSLARAIALDRELERLRKASAEADLNEYRRTCLALSGTYMLSTETECRFRHELWTAATGWQDFLEPTRFLVQAMYFDFQASMDAEWGPLFFKSFQPRPMLLDIAPVMNKATWPMDKRPRKIVTGPVERLLVLTYALLYRVKHKHWPEKPAGPSELGQAGSVPESDVTKWSRGSRHMTVREGLNKSTNHALVR